MKNLKNKIEYVVMSKQFGMIHEIATDACNLSKQLNLDVMFVFNDTEVFVNPDSNPDRIAENALKCVEDCRKHCFTY